MGNHGGAHPANGNFLKKIWLKLMCIQKKKHKLCPGHLGYLIVNIINHPADHFYII